MKYKVEVIADSSREWYGTGLTFATVADAQAHAHHIYFWWRSVRAWRVIDDEGRIQAPAGGLTVRRLRKPGRLPDSYCEGGGDQIN